MGKHKTTAGSFTPGPWEQIKIKNPHVPGATCIYEKLPRHNAGGVFQHKIAEVIPWDNDHANARLIAAAPELLAELSSYPEPCPESDFVPGTPEYDETLREWNARRCTAIAKATGK